MEENTVLAGASAGEPASPQALTVVDGAKKDPKGENKETQEMKENFLFFGPITALYALFYAFCMYKNHSGVTFPFFMSGSLWYFCCSMKKLGLTLKRDRWFYLISIMVLSVSTFCTGDERIIRLNALAIFLLLISFLLGQFFETRKWGLGKYLAAIPELLFGSLGEFTRPFMDGVHYAAKHPDRRKTKIYYVILGLVITVPIFLIIAGLLASADAVFRQVADKLMTAVNLDNVFGVGFTIAFWYFAVYMLVAFLCKKSIKEEVKDHRTGEPILAITVTSMLSLLYLYFCWIQVACLFLGTMALPEGYTYAEYAREGFFQLLAVAVFNLIMVLSCLAFFQESKLLKGVLTVMSLCTFVMIASSAMRMILYVQVYNLTFLRILVLWALAVLTFLFAGVLLCIYREGFPLFRYSVIVVTCFHVILAFSHPDLIIAKVNLENTDGKLDYHYLAGLSSDAAPVLIPYLKEQGYDFSVMSVPVKEIQSARGGKSYVVPYWDEVSKLPSVQGKTLSRDNASTFGYFYLDTLRDMVAASNMRNFNLSRYLATYLAR